MIKFIILLFYIVNISCSNNICLGPPGEFIAVPTISINNCIGIFPDLSAMKLEIDHPKECGIHQISHIEIIRNNDKCKVTEKRELNVYKDKYYGFIIIEIECPDRRKCMTVWELDFQENR